MTNQAIVDHILKSEGWPKYGNDPNDRGGPTKGGITLGTLQDFRGRAVGVEELQNLTEAEAREIYEWRYIVTPKFDQIADDLLRLQVVDAGVLSGPGRAVQWLQEAAGVAIDAALGPRTLAAVAAQPAHAVALRFAAARIAGLARIVSRDPSQSKFVLGWMNRATSFLTHEATRATTGGNE